MGGRARVDPASRGDPTLHALDRVGLEACNHRCEEVSGVSEACRTSDLLSSLLLTTSFLPTKLLRLRTLKAELVEHLRVLIELGVGRRQQLVARENAGVVSKVSWWGGQA